jgi:nucleotide-binding universal stress UspA family protein
LRVTQLGEPAAVILDYARKASPDLIVMSTRGSSGVSRWLMGSTAERVLRHADVPLILVPVRRLQKKRP